jgi:hypothetical protein
MSPSKLLPRRTAAKRVTVSYIQQQWNKLTRWRWWVGESDRPVGTQLLGTDQVDPLPVVGFVRHQSAP